jgi:hypothetical protein
MRLDTARRFALSLPDTTEEPWRRKAPTRVRDAFDAQRGG